MKLYCSLTSPYARKVRVTVRELGLTDRVEEVIVDPWTDPALLLDNNPLGKVPALLTDDGWTLPDSRLIVDYLESLARGEDASSASVDWEIARRAQLADGVMDAAVAMVVESRKRPRDYVWQGWLDRQETAIARTLDALEIEAAALLEDQADRAEISLACALAYLDLRFPDIAWRDPRPGLAAWHAVFNRRRAMLDTRPPA